MDLLLIDYDSCSLHAYRDVFEMWGFRVTACSHGDELRRLIDNCSFDAVITELDLPDTRRSDLIPMLRQKMPDSPLIVLTDHQSVQSAIFAIKNGADDFIQKPFEIEKLKELLLRTIKYRQTADDEHLDWQLEYRSNALVAAIGQVLAKMKKAQNELKFWELLQRTSFEHVSDAILMLDQEEKVVIINKKMKQLLGISQLKADHQRFFQDYPELKTTILYSVFIDILARPQNLDLHRLEFRRPHDHQLLALDLKVVPIKTMTGGAELLGLIFVIYRVTKPQTSDRAAVSQTQKRRKRK